MRSEPALGERVTARLGELTQTLLRDDQTIKNRRNEDSADLSVIRVRTQSLITMIPVGTNPRSIAIKLF